MKDNDPLSFLQTVYMDAELPLTTRMRAAMAILPFIHPKLAVIAQVQENDLAELLDRRLRKIEEMKANGKLIDAPKLIEPPAPPPQIAARIDIKPPKPHVNDRRFRRF
jgi:hypothetical protein